MQLKGAQFVPGLAQKRKAKRSTSVRMCESLLANWVPITFRRGDSLDVWCTWCKRVSVLLVERTLATENKLGQSEILSLITTPPPPWQRPSSSLFVKLALCTSHRAARLLHGEDTKMLMITIEPLERPSPSLCIYCRMVGNSHLVLSPWLNASQW